jgi:CubicO group peptidase (beta-lactamase class C family)
LSTQVRYEPSPAPVREYLLEFVKKRGIPGLQVAVVQNGKIAMLDSLGLANVEHRAATTRESVFSINSMTKAFTGVALMQLVEAGHLDLGAPISRYLEGLPESWHRITVRQLASLTSGLPEIMAVSDSGVSLIGDGGEQEAWSAAYALPMQFAPGEGYRYVQTNFALLGKIIDRTSGKPFTQFIRERQFVPAGMSHTLFADDRDIIPNRADTYAAIDLAGDAVEKIVKTHINWPPILKTAAGMHSTAEDLARWVIALQSGGLIEQATSLKTLWNPVAHPDGRPGAWAICWPMVESALGRIAAPAGGSKAQIAIYPNGVAVVLLTNLIGAIPEHMAVMSDGKINLTFMDEIARCFAS